MVRDTLLANSFFWRGERDTLVLFCKTFILILKMSLDPLQLGVTLDSRA